MVKVYDVEQLIKPHAALKSTYKLYLDHHVTYNKELLGAEKEIKAILSDKRKLFNKLLKLDFFQVLPKILDENIINLHSSKTPAKIDWLANQFHCITAATEYDVKHCFILLEDIYKTKLQNIVAPKDHYSVPKLYTLENAINDVVDRLQITVEKVNADGVPIEYHILGPNKNIIYTMYQDQMVHGHHIIH